MSSKRNAPYRHQDGSGCWTGNSCSRGSMLNSISAAQQAASKGDVTGFLAAKKAEKLTKPDAKTLLTMFKVKQEVVKPVAEYRISHKAPHSSDADTRSIDKLLEVFPEDILEHHDWYSSPVEPEVINSLRSIQGNPKSMITIYRAVPHGINKFNDGDWVTMSHEYAIQHGIDADGPNKDWPVISMKVPASSVWSDGNDLNEFGVSF